jgi:hypothetical protein
MSALRSLVERATADSRGEAPVGSKQWMEAQTDEMRAYFLAYGRVPPPARQPVVRISGPSILDGRQGLSNEAVELFALIQKAGGAADLSAFPVLRRRTRLDDLMRLVEELEHQELVTHRGPVVHIRTDYRNAMVVSDVDWRRWS